MVKGCKHRERYEVVMFSVWMGDWGKRVERKRVGGSFIGY